MSNINIKQLISPFLFMPSELLHSHKKQVPRPLCKCDSDDDQEMAPECAFICNGFRALHDTRRTTKKRNHDKAHLKKTKRTKRNKK